MVSENVGGKRPDYSSWNNFYNQFMQKSSSQGLPHGTIKHNMLEVKIFILPSLLWYPLSDHQPTSGFFMALTGSEAYALHQFHNSYETFIACLCTSV